MLTAGQTVTAETKPVGDNPDIWNRDTDTKISIMDESGAGEPLDSDDDGGNDWYSRASYKAEADGVVYVRVHTSRTPDSADDRSMNRGDYLLRIDVASEEVEPNNTFTEADANPLTPGFIDASYDADAGDQVDIFKLSLQADWIYHVRTIKRRMATLVASLPSCLRAAIPERTCLARTPRAITPDMVTIENYMGSTTSN